MAMFTYFSSFSQDNTSYYIELKQGVYLGTVQKTVHTDQTITISTAISDFSSFINAKTVYTFEKAFPTAVTPILQRVYLLTLDENEPYTDFSQRNEVENIVELENPVLSNDLYPDDYYEILYDNLPNTALELIKAPLAWAITKGDPNVLVGISDTKIDLDHEDLQGQIVMNLNNGSDTRFHGTSVASLVAANTNNGKGMASIGYKTKLVSANIGVNKVLELSQVPGIKVINISWLSGVTYNLYDDKAFNEVAANGVLVVAAAGNNKPIFPPNVYRYPASYESPMSVTSVGHRYPIGFHNPYFWGRSWKDCHEYRPHIPSNTSSHTHNDKVDVSSPGHRYLSATDDYAAYPSGYKTGTGTSGATPFVSGLAALIFSVNPFLTPAEVKNIIKTTTDDIYHIPYNQPYIGLLGTGRINAYRAVKTAQCMLTPTAGLDLAMQNSPGSSFEEPDTQTPYPWESRDIWVRNQNDGNLIEAHQNPEYDANNPNYVYVKVTNNSCETSSGNDNLKLYWAKANTELSWPLHWEGQFTVMDPITGQNVLMGDEVGTIAIPQLGIGETKVLEFQWNVPNPDDYININISHNPWHFCLLARIESADDPMTFPEGLSTLTNTLNNNNIAWRNITVIDIVPGSQTTVSGVVAVGNSLSTSRTVTLEFLREQNELGKAIYDEAEITLEMDDVLYNAWQAGQGIGSNFKDTNTDHKKIATGNNLMLQNIQFGPNELGTLSLSFNFLTKELTSKTEFIYHVIQRDATTNEIIGGETFNIRKQPRDIFTANAGDDTETDRNEPITISAAQINEAAVYNWYNPNGALIYTGTDLTVSLEVSTTYTLEIISDTDGYKDYDEIEVTVNPYKLESLVPNPATNQVTVNYEADEATSAYLMVVSNSSGTSNNYILDTTLLTTSLDISSYTNGLYTIALVCDGIIQTSKTLVKQ